MLQLRLNCALCDKDLPPDALDARIGADGGAFRASCVRETPHDVRPVSGECILTKHGVNEIAGFAAGVEDTPLRDR